MHFWIQLEFFKCTKRQNFADFSLDFPTLFGFLTRKNFFLIHWE